MRRSAPLQAVACALAAFALTSLPGCADVTPARYAAPAQTFAFPPAPVAEARPPAAPLRLTSSDGRGLRLASLDARAIVEEPLAFTEIRLAFDNPEDRVLEGTFQITLPEGAALSRFAMRMADDSWQEGEVVEKKQARRAYEDFLHRRQDPALLEQAAGNEFSARVFPIPAHARKEIVVAYSQELGDGRPYALPLRGLPELGQLDVTVTLAGEASPIASIHRTAYAPADDFRLDDRKVAPGQGLRAGNLVLARVHPIPSAPPDPLGATLILVDTSASRALGFEDELRLVAQLAARVAETAGSGTPLVVACYDQTTDLVYDGPAGMFGAREVQRMRARQAFGASDLGRAIGWAEAAAKGRGIKRVLVVGDGVATAGEVDAGALAARAAKLAGAGVERIDAIAVGGIRDDGVLRKIATAGLSRDGVVADASADPAGVVRRIERSTRSGIAVVVEGARWWFPERLDGVQPGDEVRIYADVPEGQPVRVTVGGAKAQEMDLVSVERPLLERAWVKARIDSLLEQQGGEKTKDEVVRQVVALSTAHRVISPYTSLLVLETDRDYARFGLDRKALADILTVQGGRLAVAHRSTPADEPNPPKLADVRPRDPAPQEAERSLALRAPSAPIARWAAPEPAAATPPPPAPPPAASAASPGADPMSARGNMWGSDIGDSFGAGGLGLSGIGEGGGGHSEGIGLGAVGSLGHGAGQGTAQGFGSGHGRLGGAHKTATPSVRMGATQVSGRLPPEVIQRIVRQNFGRFRACYENGLRERPGLSGRLLVKFVIQPDGSIAGVGTAGADEVGAGVAACVVRAFQALTFPAPEGGHVTVTYPLTFTPESGGARTDPPPDRTVFVPEAQIPAQPRVAPEPPVPPEGTPSAPPPVSEKAMVGPYTGRFQSVMDAIGAGGAKGAIATAFAWHNEAPGDVMALVALGEALEAAGEPGAAARAYGSIIDLFPGRADLRRFAGERLERLKGDAGLDLAIDTFTKAEEERPDHPASHRLLAYALLKKGEPAQAFAAAVRGLEHHYPDGRFPGVEQILREDVGLIAAAWIKAEPRKRDEILAKVAEAGGEVEDAPSLRFVLNWETDANDVDFHIFDADGGHAYYRDKVLPSGGNLYADVTTGYGPECFTIRGPKGKRSPHYDLKAHYYARGPMGYGMGKLEIIDHDGKGGLTFDERPFVVMRDKAFVELGSVDR
jgi:tetratricopeptide (TPR) repeat protein